MSDYFPYSMSIAFRMGNTLVGESFMGEGGQIVRLLLFVSHLQNSRFLNCPNNKRCFS